MTTPEYDSAAGAIRLAAFLGARVRRAIEARLRPLDLTYPQYQALSAIDSAGKLSQAQLARALDTDATTAMVLRTSLEKKGLVDRKTDSEDARIRHIALGDRGQAKLAEASPLVEAFMAEAGAIINEVELKRLIPMLKKMVDFAGDALPKVEGDADPKPRGRPRKKENQAQSPDPAPNAKSPGARRAKSPESPGRMRVSVSEAKKPKAAGKAPRGAKKAQSKIGSKPLAQAGSARKKKA